MSKQHILYFAIVVALLIIAPGIAGAAPKTIPVHGVYHNITANQAEKILENKGTFSYSRFEQKHMWMTVKFYYSS